MWKGQSRCLQHRPWRNPRPLHGGKVAFHDYHALPGSVENLVSGYFRMSADEWEPEHYRSRWTPENRAPRWWAWADCAWYIDRRRLPAARKLAEHWGWTKSSAYAFARSVAIEQRAWELRPDVRTYLDGLISPDKTRTATVELRGQVLDTRVPSNAEKSAGAWTEPGHFSDTSRTDRGHLTGARSESTSTAASSPSAQTPLRGVQGGDLPPEYDDNDPFAFPLPPLPQHVTQPTPAPRPPVAPVAPSPRVYGAPASRLPAGVPSDLPALLSAGPGVRGLEVEGLRAVGRISVIECLLQAGIEDVEMLLTVDPARLPFCGVKDTVVASLRRHLRARWGLELGCLAEPERAPEPVRVPIVPGYPQYPHEGGYAFADRRYRERLAGIRPLDSFPEASNG